MYNAPYKITWLPFEGCLRCWGHLYCWGLLLFWVVFIFEVVVIFEGIFIFGVIFIFEVGFIFGIFYFEGFFRVFRLYTFLGSSSLSWCSSFLGSSSLLELSWIMRLSFFQDVLTLHWWYPSSALTLFFDLCAYKPESEEKNVLSPKKIVCPKNFGSKYLEILCHKKLRSREILGWRKSLGSKNVEEKMDGQDLRRGGGYHQRRQ